MKNILLFNLPIKMQFEKFLEDEVEYNPSLGLLAIASYLRIHGYNTIIIDFNFEMYSIDMAISHIDKAKPVLIGVTAFTENYKEVIQFCKQIKKLCGDIKTLVGGPHATLAPQDIIKSGYVDFVSIKEGEATLLELLECIGSNGKSISLEQIDGLLYRQGKDIKKNKPRRHIKNLDLLPIINRSLVGIERYTGTVNISTSRGCPANCIYCAATTIAGATYRMRDISGVFLEMLLLKHLIPDLKKVYFVDDTFTALPERVYAFTDLMRECPVGVQWSCESRVDVMTEELVDKMILSGCYSIQFGIESGNQSVLDKLRKKIDLQHAYNIIVYAARYDVEICLSFMLGHYCDTIATMQETLCFIERSVTANHNVKIGVSYNTPLPGTWQFTNADKIGLYIQTHDYSKYDLITPIVETDNFTVSDLCDIFNQAAKYMKI